MGEDLKATPKSTELEKLVIFKEKNRYEPAESLAVAMENQILLDIRSVIDGGLVTEIFSQNSPISSENFNLETALINNPLEEGLASDQDNHLRTLAVGETLLDHFKYPLAFENPSALAKVEVCPHANSGCDREDLEKYKELNYPEEAEHMHSPYLASNGVHFLSPVVMQHKNGSDPSSSISSLEGAVSQNVRMIPVFRSLIPQVAGENNYICYDQFKGIHNSSMQSQNLPDCLNDSASGDCSLPQTSASVYDEIAEIREAVSNVMENDQDEAVFQNANVDESGCKLLALHSVLEEPSCSHRNDSNPVVICQLDGGTQILCINSSGTRELKTVHLIPQYQDQHNYLQSDVGNPVAAVLGQLLPVPGKLDLNEKQFENGSLQSVASTATYHSESNLQGPGKITSVGLQFGSGDTKSKKPCNCTKSQCLKLYCDCFANGDFCNNCNCNNCYNNPLHETERFKAIKGAFFIENFLFLVRVASVVRESLLSHPLQDTSTHSLHTSKDESSKPVSIETQKLFYQRLGKENWEKLNLAIPKDVIAGAQDALRIIAKIMCSSICKCIGCKNYEESPDQKKQLNMPNYMDIGNNEGNSPVLTTAFEMFPKLKTDRQPAVCISWEEVKATCAYLLVQAEEAEKGGYSGCLAERMILEEFGRCLSQILHA